VEGRCGRRQQSLINSHLTLISCHLAFAVSLI